MLEQTQEETGRAKEKQEPNDPKGLCLYSPPAHEGKPDPEEGQGEQECGDPQDPEEISGQVGPHQPTEVPHRSSAGDIVKEGRILGTEGEEAHQ